MPILPDAGQARVLALGDLLENDLRLAMLRRDHRRHTRFDDARLLGRDQRQGVAQQRGVLQADGGDDADGRGDDVGGVQPAAQPHLQHHPIDLLLGEVEQGQHGHDLEGGDAGDGLDGRLALLQQAHHIVLGDQLAVDADALAEGVQVGRAVEAGAQTRRAQDRVDGGRGGAFALAAGHMDIMQTLMRIAQRAQHPPGALQVPGGFGVGHGAATLVVHVVEDVVQGGLIVGGQGQGGHSWGAA
jgi:hypothetical protein